MSGVSDVFLLMLGVDVVLGPLVTLVVFNTRKPRAELVRDLAVVVLVQLGESRLLAERMVERALQVEGAKAAAEVLVATALRLRGSV